MPQPTFVHLAGEPLVAVDVDLHREREPGLHARVAEAELAVEEVRSTGRDTSATPGGSSDGPPVRQAEAATGLDSPEDAPEALGDHPVRLGDAG